MCNPQLFTLMVAFNQMLQFGHSSKKESFFFPLEIYSYVACHYLQNISTNVVLSKVHTQRVVERKVLKFVFK